MSPMQRATPSKEQPIVSSTPTSPLAHRPCSGTPRWGVPITRTRFPSFPGNSQRCAINQGFFSGAQRAHGGVCSADGARRAERIPSNPTQRLQASKRDTYYYCDYYYHHCWQPWRMIQGSLPGHEAKSVGKRHEDSKEILWNYEGYQEAGRHP
jgi:hypothetical protein